MVRVDSLAAGRLLAREWEEDAETGWRRLMALGHANRHDRLRIHADQVRRPRTLLLSREVGGRREVYAAGEVGPALPWLVALGGPVTLAAPPAWTAPVEALVGTLERAHLLVRRRPEPGAPEPEPGPAQVRALGIADLTAFAAIAPGWSTASWESARACLYEGRVFGVPDRAGHLTALAWVLEDDGERAAIGAWTVEPFRRLGLGHSVAGALTRYLLREARRVPLWFSRAENEASLGLATALGFTLEHEEVVLRWNGRAK